MTTFSTNRVPLREAAVAAAVFVAASTLSVGPGAAGASPDIPNRERYAQRYMRIVCPVNAQNEREYDAWIRAFGKNRVRVGTPVPKYLRREFRRSARVASKAAVKTTKAWWPKVIRSDMERMEKFYYSLPPYYRARDTDTVRRSWKKRYYDPGNASTRIRRALELPPSGEGCGKYV